ncbi:MAG: hypothetical protein H0V82_03615 [Candidatus Protochlamydia sp.]|nr:hypothetical protein [Candidatus Protochlamydia sp.]
MQASNYNHYLPKENEVKEILNKVYSVCVFGSTNKSKNANIEKKILSSLVALDFKINELKNPFIATISQSDREKMQIYGKFFGFEKKEPNNRIVRQHFLEGLIIGTKISSAFAAGYANCEGMADIAFLEAASRDFSCGIHYVRFSNKENPSVEEINTVVLGDWPKPGCLVLSPWENDFGTFYTWNGKCNNTCHLANENYNSAYSFFSIAKGDKNKEKVLIKNLLKKLDWINWLNNDRFRQDNIFKIRNDCFKQIHQTSLLNSEKYFTYKDILMYGSTNKKRYKELQETKNNLEKEFNVKFV